MSRYKMWVEKFSFQFNEHNNSYGDVILLSFMFPVYLHSQIVNLDHTWSRAVHLGYSECLVFSVR